MKKLNKVIWITGHSLSGKTTIANALSKNIDSIILDGDEMRESISLNLTYSKKDRAEHNLKVARLANILSKQSNVIVSVIAPLKKIRNEINNICSPIWIYIKKDIKKRKGHFYEVSKEYFSVDNGDVNKNVNKIIRYVYKIK